MGGRREELVELTQEFVGAFNRQNLEDIVAYFLEDGVFEDNEEHRHVGKQAIGDHFDGLVNGGSGRIRFEQEDIIVEPETSKVMVSWILKTHLDTEPQSLRGMDILYFEGDKIRNKVAYFKAGAAA